MLKQIITEPKIQFPHTYLEWSNLRNGYKKIKHQKSTVLQCKDRSKKNAEVLKLHLNLRPHLWKGSSVVYAMACAPPMISMFTKTHSSHTSVIWGGEMTTKFLEASSVEGIINSLHNGLLASHDLKVYRDTLFIHTHTSDVTISFVICSVELSVVIYAIYATCQEQDDWWNETKACTANIMIYLLGM